MWLILLIICEFWTSISQPNRGKECDLYILGKCAYAICGAEFSFHLSLLALMIVRHTFEVWI